MIIANGGLTSAGWVFMLCSLGFVVGLTVFCFARVLRKGNGDRERS